ncbi:MAG: esterase [Leptospiraceae bacterium]|nr:esterase [Leptospiraceae bacterium]
MQFKRTQYADIQTIEVENNEPDLTIVMLHGYGADASDLAPLAEHIKVERKVRWLFPEGIQQIPIGPGWFGRAWFPIDFEAIERARRSGKERDLSGAAPQGFTEAREKLMQMLAAARLDLSKTILCGFSQGSMMSVDLTLRLPVSTLGLGILSGTLVNIGETETLAKNRPEYNFFQSHGIQDPVLPFSMAEKLNKTLNNAGMRGNLLSFPGGHEIPQSVITGFSEYIQNQIEKAEQ